MYHKPNSYWTDLHLRVTYTSPLDVWGTSYEDRTVTPERPARPPEAAALDAPATGPSPSAAPAASGIKSGEPGSDEGSYADLF